MRFLCQRRAGGGDGRETASARERVCVHINGRRRSHTSLAIVYTVIAHDCNKTQRQNRHGKTANKNERRKKDDLPIRMRCRETKKSLRIKSLY